MTLTIFDFVVIAVLLYSTFRGLQRGFVWQLAWIAALVLCFGFAETLSVQLAPKIQQFAPQATPPLDRWIAMLVLYMGFSFLSFGAARVLRGWIEKAKFVEYDRHLGGIFGLVKGLLICLMGTFFLITLSERARETVLNSKSGYAAAVIMDKLQPVLPQELAKILHPYVERLDPNHDPEALNAAQSEPFNALGDVLFGYTADPNNANSAGEPGRLPGVDGGGLLDRLIGNGSIGNGSSNNGVTTGGTGVEQVSLEDFARNLPTNMSQEVRDQALNAFRNATPEQRDQIFKQVQSSLPGEVGGILDQFRGLQDRWNNFNNPPPATAGQPTASRDNILDMIAKIRSDRDDVRSDFRQQVNQRLTGVPGNVATAVLQDWKADLGLDKTDPDPATNFRTLIDVRIYRQLSAAGVPIERLSRSLQDRMRNVARQ